MIEEKNEIISKQEVINAIASLISNHPYIVSDLLKNRGVLVRNNTTYEELVRLTTRQLISDREFVKDMANKLIELGYIGEYDNFVQFIVMGVAKATSAIINAVKKKKDKIFGAEQAEEKDFIDAINLKINRDKLASEKKLEDKKKN